MSPLAVCDGSTVKKEDCVSVDLVKTGDLSSYTGDTILLLPSKAYRWYFLSEQQPDEVTLMKIFDSDNRCAAKCGFNPKVQDRTVANNHSRLSAYRISTSRGDFWKNSSSEH